MKTQHIITRAVLALAALILHTQADAQDAFYIYRNDGEFNGFFYDQVKRMGYSRTDLEGVDHDVYVVQEVETDDSLYRIPLAAIDSVGFQQPEIIFNPRLRNLDDEGISDYVNYSFGNIISIRNDAPSNLIPKVGDVLVSYNNRVYDKDVQPLEQNETSYHEPGGFGGKVTAVTEYPDNGCWLVETDQLSDLSDIFVQFVGVEQVGFDEDGNVRRRVAGMEYDEKSRRWTPKKAKSGSGSVCLANFNLTLHADKDLGGGNSASVELGVGMKSTLQAAYNISWRRVFFKLESCIDASAGMSLALKSSREFEAEITGVPPIMNKILFPAACPIFQTKPLPMAFIRGGGELAAKLKSPTFDFGFRQTITYDTDAGYLPRFDFSCKGADSEEAENSSLFNTGDLELSLNGYIQAGLKFSANISTNDWISDIFQSLIACDLYVGPKVEGALSISTAKLAQSGSYAALNDSYIKLHAISSDIKAHAMIKMLWKDPQYVNFLDYSEQFGSVEWKPFLSFKESVVNYDEKNNVVNASVFPLYKTFLPNTLCIGLYDSYGDRVDQYEHSKSYFLKEDTTEISTTFSTANLPCGYYTIRPYLKVAGYEIDVPIGWQEFRINPKLDLKQKTVEVKGDQQSIVIPFFANVKNVRMTALDENKEFNSSGIWWIQSVDINQNEVKERETPALKANNTTNNQTVTIGFNNDCKSFWDRTAYIVLYANYNGETVSDTLMVKKKGNDDIQLTEFTGGINLPVTVKKTEKSSTKGTKYNYVYKPDSDVVAYVESVPINVENSSNEEYDETLSWKSDEDATTVCQRNGNLLTVKREYYDERDVPGGSFTYADGTTHEYYNHEIHLNDFEVVIDLSERPGKVISGKATYEHTTTTNYDYDYRVSGDPMGKWGTWNKLKKNYRTITWTQDVPCTDIWEGSNGGSLIFDLDGVIFNQMEMAGERIDTYKHTYKDSRSVHGYVTEDAVSEREVKEILTAKEESQKYNCYISIKY